MSMHDDDLTVNAALIGDVADTVALRATLDARLPIDRALVVSDDPAFLPGLGQRMSFDAAALDRVMIDPEDVMVALRGAIGRSRGLVVDMAWALARRQGTGGLELWGGTADRLARDLGLPVICVYAHDLAIEEQMQAILRAHRQFAARSGLYRNPFWIPAAMLDAAPLDEQLSFLLGRAVPDYQGMLARRHDGQMFARGTTPSWLGQARPMLGGTTAAARWHVHCLGRLRVFVGNRPVDWRLPGGAANKTRTLFAYLLQTGDKGAHADRIGELLWPEDGTEDQKRARLHHAVAMLRKALGDPAAVLREGEYYRLNAPPGSWTDIDTFEQLCRRGLSLFKRGELTAAMHAYGAAVQLYAGDLFEDLPLQYVRSDTDDWCMLRRIWLREMAVKLMYDFARVCVLTGRTREALDHCQRALAIDPASEGANAEAMRIFVAQGRVDAMHRQYRQYRAALDAIGAPEGAEIRALYRELAQAPLAAKEKQEKPGVG
jgi:DNA-binding SARP family transcriptional activator